MSDLNYYEYTKFLLEVGTLTSNQSKHLIRLIEERQNQQALKDKKFDEDFWEREFQ